MTKEIVLSDSESLKDRKIEEFTKGERPDGRKIGKYRSEEYADFKNQINPRAGFGYIDLMLSRSFVGNMFVRPFTRGSFRMDSTDSKTGNLLGKYGSDIMGLNQDWFEKRQKEIYRFVLIQKIKKVAQIR
jgi:hypothetical protein